MKEINDNKTRSSRRNKKRGFWRALFSLIKWTTLLFIVGISLGILAVVLLVDYELEDMPAVDSQYLKTYPTSEITDNKGNVIWKSTESKVEVIEYDEIPTLYEEMLISVEDKEFWESKGFSPKGIANMTIGTIRSKIDSSYKARGGSTIDQQLIKNKYFNRGYGHNVVKRKIQELFLSMQLNQNFSKQEILTFYVNDLEFAERAKGIKAIMKTYFNKNPEAYNERTPENIAEQAYLVGLSQAPTTYNLYVSPEDARKRMLTVLSIAREDNIISQKEYESAKEHNLEDNLQERNWESNEQHQKNLKYKTYTDGVKKELENLGYNLNDVSLRIETHLDTEMYNKIEKLVREGNYYLDDNQQIAVSVINSDGIVVGMVGSRNNKDELNRAMQTSRSTGSSTKPLLAYAPLLQYFGNQYNTASKFDTSNYRYPGSSATMHNYGKAVYGYQTIRDSLVKSYNTPVGRIMDEVLGSNRVKAFLAGLDLDIQDKFTSVDGLGIHASTLQIAAAYNAFNNLGEFTAPRFINKITFTNNEEIVINPKRRQAMSPSVAWVTNHMMRGVPNDGGTAREAKIEWFQGYAGKTGTVGFDKSANPPSPYGIGSSDLWYNSFTNNGYSISVWTGYDKPNTSPQLPSYHRKQQNVGKDLQLMLNKNAPPLWKMPNGVSKISGEGINAHYRVTNSAYLLYSVPNWRTLDNYKSLEIEDVIGDDSVDENWFENENSKWFEYYQSGGNLDPRIIDESLYNKMNGGN